jgi:DNA-directed RNA polymerase sigma subunit (sigma70/sigma32)
MVPDEPVQLPAEIAALLLTLEETEVEVVRLRFGLDRGNPRTFAEVGEELGLAPEEVQAIEERAVEKWRGRGPGSETG